MGRVLAGGGCLVAAPLQARLSVASAEGSEEQRAAWLRGTEFPGLFAQHGQVEAEDSGENWQLVSPDGTEFTGRT